MDKSPLVDIHIVTYNNEDTIRQCLTSVCNQNYENISVLLVDNSSSDKTVKIASSFPVSVVVNSKNDGYAKAHNQAIRKSVGEYVLTLNPDVKLDVSYVAQVIHTLKKYPNIGSVAGLLFRVDSLNKQSHIIDAAGVVMKRNRQQGLRFETKDSRKLTLHDEEIFGPDGAVAFYKREMLQDISINGEIFDEDFFMHKEDIDIIWRAQLRGWNSRFTPFAKAYHIRTFRPGKRANISSRLRMLGLRNRYCLLVKNDQLIPWLKHSPYICFYDACVFLYVLFFERQTLSAYSSFFQLLPKMKKKRIIIQQKRRVSWETIYSWFK